MASWSQVLADSPHLAARVQERFEASRHKTMATLRADGSPRISGTETRFVDGEITCRPSTQGGEHLPAAPVHVRTLESRVEGCDGPDIRLLQCRRRLKTDPVSPSES